MSSSDSSSAQSDDRRQFLRGAALTAAAAVGGASLAWWRSGNQPPSPISCPPPVQPAVQTLVTPASDPNEMLAQLASIQAENMRLQAALDAANRRLELAELGRTDASSERDLLQTELASAHTQVGLLTGLVALYEQLDGFDLGETVSNGVDVLQERLNGLVEELPGLTNGIADGELVLSRFESDIPSLQDGRDWLEANTAEMKSRWQSVGETLREVVDQATENALEMLANWFNRLLGWVPFEFGQRARNSMDSIYRLMVQTPATIEGAQVLVLDRWDKWFAPRNEGDDALPAQVDLVDPLRYGVIQSAGQTVPKIEEAQVTFENELKLKAAELIANRETVREEIRAFREENRI